jgi:hypothetical protein
MAKKSRPPLVKRPCPALSSLKISRKEVIESIAQMNSCLIDRRYIEATSTEKEFLALIHMGLKILLDHNLKDSTMHIAINGTTMSLLTRTLHPKVPNAHRKPKLEISGLEDAAD